MLRFQRGKMNAVLLFSALLASTIYMSELGGAGSIWTVVTWALSLWFISVNLRKALFQSVFMIPIAFVFISTIANLGHLPPAGIRSALATVIGFLLFALPPLMLDKRLMSRLVTAYLLFVGALSTWLLMSNPERLVGGNINFNVNPNAAAQLFYVCGALALFLLRSRMKWFAVLVFGLLMITTQARTANVVFLMTVGAYLITGERRSLPRFSTILRAIAGFLAGLAVVLLAGRLLRPDDFDSLMDRFRDLSNPGSFTRSRWSIWRVGIELALESPGKLLFGHGAAQISLLIGRGAHSSYITALASFGILFLGSSLMAMVAWMWSFAKRGYLKILAIAIPILLYGVTDTFVFSGVSFPWFLLAFISIIVAAVPTEELAATSRAHGSVSLSPRRTHGRWVLPGGV